MKTTKELYDAIMADSEETPHADITVSINTLSHLIYYAQSIGVQRVCDKHTAIIKGMRQRAKDARYHNLANAIIGKGPDQIYDPSYADAFEFGDWETGIVQSEEPCETSTE